jgi:thiosulfate/3-mercaptopyruvate sulfurtransferase
MALPSKRPRRSAPPGSLPDLASPQWVQGHLGSSWLRVLDVRTDATSRFDESGVRLSGALELELRPAFVELDGRDGDGDAKEGWVRAGPRPAETPLPLSFLRGHVRGASSLDVGRTLFDDGDPGRPVSAPELAMAMSELGVDDDHTVLLVDEGAGGAAAVAAWVLRRYGHEATLVLDGGLARWVAEGRPLTQNIERFPFASFTARAPR